MKINAVFLNKANLKKPNIFSSEFNKKYILTIYLSLAVITGTIIYLSNKSDINTYYSELFENFFYISSRKNNFDIFISLLKILLPYILLMLIFSTSTIGEILIYMLAFISFSGMSTYTSFIYNKFGIAGIKYCFTVFLPGRVLFILGSLILIELCINRSRDYKQKIVLSEQDLRKNKFAFFISLIVFLLSACIDLLFISTILPKSDILTLF